MIFIFFFLFFFFADVPESESDSETETTQESTTILKLDDWVVFKLDREVARLILHLRQKWNALFLRRMKYPSRVMSHFDEHVVKAVVTVITNEEQACGLQQPLGIGQRPKPLVVDYYPANARRSDDVDDVSDENIQTKQTKQNIDDTVASLKYNEKFFVVNSVSIWQRRLSHNR